MSLDHHPRRVELAALLSRIVGELLDEVLVGAAEKIGLGHAVVAQRNLREVLDQAREHGVAVPGVAELAFVVVVDAGEDALQRAVLLLQRRARLVQRLADVRGPLLDGAPPRPVRHEELVLVRVGPRDILGHALRDKLLRLLLEPVRQPLQEEQPEDVGLVVAAVDRPAQDVRRDQRYCSSCATLSTLAGGSGSSRRRDTAIVDATFGDSEADDATAGPTRRATRSAFFRPASSRPNTRHSSFRRSRESPHLVETRFPGTGKGVDELRRDASIVDRQPVEIGAQLGASAQQGRRASSASAMSLVGSFDHLDLHRACPMDDGRASDNDRTPADLQAFSVEAER